MNGTLQHWKIVHVLETILIVDNDEPTRKSLKLLLELHGYRVVEAVTGIEALQILNEWHQDIQLAICSEELPDMTAGQWRGQLRFLGPDIPSFILSEKEKNVIANIEVHNENAVFPVTVQLPIRLLERIRMAIDERFFANRMRASAA